MNKRSPNSQFTAQDWSSAALLMSRLEEVLHETAALQIFFKKVQYSAIGAAHGMRATGVWLHGEAGSGKTTALRECVRRLELEPVLASGLPSIYLPLLPSPSMHSIVRDILLQLDYPFATSRTFSERASLLFTAIRARMVRVILLDETQHIVEGKRVAHFIEIRDFLKRLMDETNVVLVLAGLPKAKKLQQNDAQLASRMPAEVCLSEILSESEAKRFVEVVMDGLKISIDENAMEKLVDVQSYGQKASLRLLKMLVEESVKIAALTKSSTVTLAHVCHALTFTLLRAWE